MEPVAIEKNQQPAAEALVASAADSVITDQHQKPRFIPKPPKRRKLSRIGRSGSGNKKNTNFDWAAYRLAHAAAAAAQTNDDQANSQQAAAPSKKPKSPLKKQLKKEHEKLKKENTQLKTNEKEKKKEIVSLKERNESLERENKEFLAKLHSTGAGTK
mmetsp:Transcript_29598/g.62773  ORF Transcript_29598/g.62773 Transcript_29598/m.62773 type:complete len:158 (-) Transcript_29598:270-743(-)